MALPPGSLTWLGTLGSGAIAVSAMVSLVAAVFALRGKTRPMLLFVACAGFFVALGVVVALFATGQFQFEYVRSHTQSDYALQYKLAGTWSGQEGSFLLWAVCSSLFTLLTIRKAGKYQRWMTAVHGFFLAGLGAILMLESPFDLAKAGVDTSQGIGMAPSLLNYWMVIHPPTIFCGFGLLTSLFAWSVAAMLERDLETWVAAVRPWAILGVSLLGVGLAMGGFWAYETLGWGGFWMWDPVENTSFVPWVALTAFVHGVFVQKAKRGWQLTNAVLGGVPFLLFGYGTFLTRSGFLGGTSVHSFAQMDELAKWILIAMVVAFGAWFTAATLKARKSVMPIDAKPEGWLNKHTFYTWAVWCLLFMGVITGFGMSVPFVQSVTGQQAKVVEEPLYNTVISFAYLPLVLLMAIGPFLSWRKGDPRQLANKLINVLAASITTAGFLLMWAKWGGNEVAFGPMIVGFPGQAAQPDQTVNLLLGGIKANRTAWVLFLVWLTSFAVYANLWRAIGQVRTAKLGVGGLVAHIGVLVAMVGLVFSRGLEQTAEGIVHPSKEMPAFGYNLRLEGISKNLLDRDNKVLIAAAGPTGSFKATPGLYFVPMQNGEFNPFIWPYIASRGLYDLYFVASPFAIVDGEPDYGGSQPVGLKTNELAEFNGLMIRYLGMTSEGTPGTVGAKFVARVQIQGPEGDLELDPSITIAGPGKLVRPVLDVGNGMGIMLERIDAKDKTAFLTVKYTTPAYPVTVFYKPLTILVWWGVGIMTVGGLMAAWSRRPAKPRPEPDEPDAPEPTAES